jgi:hypothetical protein
LSSERSSIRTVGKRAEDVLDRTKEQVGSATQAGQDVLRTSHQQR